MARLLAADAAIASKVIAREPGQTANSQRWTARRFPAIRGIKRRPALSSSIPLMIGYARPEETLSTALKG